MLPGMYQKYPRYATIREFPRYFISANGEIIDTDTDRIVPASSTGFVNLDGSIRKVTTLLVLAFIGNMPFPIVSVTNAPVTKYEKSKYTYRTPSLHHDMRRPNVYYIGDIEFRMIPDCDDCYIISSNGVIFDLATMTFKHVHWTSGYASFGINYNRANASGSNLVARHIYEAWIGPVQFPMQIDHKDNIRYHDVVSNIQLLTPSENSYKGRAEGNGPTAYTREQVEVVFQMMAENKSHAEIAKFLEQPYDTRANKHRINAYLFKLRNQNGYYDDLKEKYDVAHYDNSVNYSWNRLSAKDVADIKRRLANGETGALLAAEYGVSKPLISRIKNGHRVNTKEC